MNRFASFAVASLACAVIGCGQEPIPAPPPLGAVTASAAPASVHVGEPVTFTCTAQGASAPSFLWIFGDGASAAGATPLHAFATPGKYVATCAVTDARGIGSATIEVEVTPNTAPTVTVEATPRTGPAPLLVSFTCAATGGNPPYRYAWSFGDGTTVSGKDLSFEYARIARYTATCTATDRFDQSAGANVVIDATDPVVSPIIDEIVGSNGTGTHPLCSVAAADSEMRLTARVRDANTPPTGLRVSWIFEAVPFGSRATFSRTDVPETSFFTDLPGAYRVRFTATNERGRTASAAVTVTAEELGRVTFLNPESAATGVAGDDYRTSLQVKTETPCGLAYPGGAVRWSAENAQVLRADAISDRDGLANADLLLGCAATEPAVVHATPQRRLRIPFTRSDFGDEEDCIEPDVCITRETRGPAVNAGKDPILWACGRCSDAVDFVPDLRSLQDPCFEGDINTIIGRRVCLKLPTSGATWDLLWTRWTPSGGHGFSYLREGAEPLPLEGPGAAVADTYSIALEPGPAAVLRLTPQRDVPVVTAAGQKNPMLLTAQITDRCGNPRTFPEVTFDVAVGAPRTKVAFVREDGASNTDCLASDVCLTRDDSGPVYNDDGADLEWACGRCGEETSAFTTDLSDLEDACANGDLASLPGRRTCLRVVDTGATWDFTWTSFTSDGNGGGFSYVREGIPDGPSPACFDDLCAAEGGSGVATKSTVTTSGGVATLRAFAKKAGWVAFAATNVSGGVTSAGGWTVDGNRVDHFEDDGAEFQVGAEGDYPVDWAWGTPTGASGAHSGTRGWSTVTAGNYHATSGPNEEVRWLSHHLDVPCPIDPEAPIRLSYWENHDIGAGALAFVSAGSPLGDPLLGANGLAPYDVVLGARSGYQGTSGAWREVRLDLGKHRCQSLDANWTLFLKNAATARDGWTIDDVAVEYLSDHPNAAFVGGPVNDGTITKVRDGIASCATSPAVVRIATKDLHGNASASTNASIVASGGTNARIAGASPGRVVSGLGLATAAVDVGVTGTTEVSVLSNGAGPATVTLKAPAGDRAGTVAFTAATANETTTCEDGIDNDCDGKVDCADTDCAGNLACRCLDGSERARAARSCAAIRNDCGSTASGRFWIDPNGGAAFDAFEVYCDNSTAGGGWVLVMQLASSTAGDTTLGYNSEHWTTADTLNDTVPSTLNNVNAKYATFNRFVSTAGTVMVKDRKTRRFSVLAVPEMTGKTLLDRFQNLADTKLTVVSGQASPQELMGYPAPTGICRGPTGRWQINMVASHAEVRLGNDVASNDAVTNDVSQWTCYDGGDQENLAYSGVGGSLESGRQWQDGYGSESLNRYRDNGGTGRGSHNGAAVFVK